MEYHVKLLLQAVDGKTHWVSIDKPFNSEMFAEWAARDLLSSMIYKKGLEYRIAGYRDGKLVSISTKQYDLD